MKPLAMIAVLVLAGCGANARVADSGLPPRDAGSSTPVPFDAGAYGYGDAGTPDAGLPVIPPAAPMILPYQGGPTLSDIELVTLTYAGHPFQSQIDTFGDFIPDSGWLSAVGAEYGIHVAGHASFTIPGYAPSSFGEYDALGIVQAGWDAGFWPRSFGDGGLTAVWLVVYPPGVPSDVFFHLGEHYFTLFDGGALIAGYVSARDADAGADQFESVLSHELIEAATDPFAGNEPAYVDFYGGLFTRTNFAETEVADLCQTLAPAYEAGFAFTRSWSNAASEAGLDPCVPAPDLPYANLLGPTRPILAGPGETAVVPLHAFESNGSGPFEISIDSQWGPLDLQPTLDRTSLSPGENAALTLRVPRSGQLGQQSYVTMVSLAVDGGTPGTCTVGLLVR